MEKSFSETEKLGLSFLEIEKPNVQMKMSTILGDPFVGTVAMVLVGDY